MGPGLTMNHYQRLRYAFAVMVTLVGVLAIAGMFFPALDVPGLMLDMYVFVPLFVFGYLVAPVLGRRLKLK